MALLLLCGCSSIEDRGGSVKSPLQGSEEASFERGLGALELEDWAGAIREFERARSVDPWFPPVLANLGISHGKAGHPLAAIAWFRAYIAAVPMAGNAASVRTEVSRLEEGVDASVRKALETAWTRALAKKDRPCMQGILRSRAFLGDVEGALTLARAADAALLPESEAWSLHVMGRARAGEAGGFEEALRHVEGARDWDEAWKAIGYGRIAELDLSGAGDAALHVHDTGAALKLLEDAEKARGDGTSFKDRPTAQAVAAFSLKEWTKFADSLSSNRLVVDPAAVLAEAGAADDAGARTARTGAELGLILLDAKGMARRHERMLERFRAP
jgi:tetratricopeptide (TPR) repeat protein